MNIFVLSTNPVEAARAQVDKHVIKMVLETAQLLCSPYETGVAPYKRSHYNHPCAVWTRTSADNFNWLCEHGRALSDEYARRYGKGHKSAAVIEWAEDHQHQLFFPKTGLTPFAQAMPDEYRDADAVAAYRKYYQGAKARFASWRPPSTPPDWWSLEVTHGASD